MSAPEMTDTLAAAVAFRDRGWRPFPLDHPAARGDALNAEGKRTGCCGAHPTAKRPDKGIPCDGKRGKHPIGGWATQAATAQTDKMLELWFGGRVERNIGIATKPSGLVVLDEDELDALAAYAAELGQTLPITYRVRTSRGWHYYFTAPDGIVIRGAAAALKARHIDVRGNYGEGGYVVAAGSVHESGHVYEAEDPYVEPAPLPGWLVDVMLGRVDGDAGTSAGPSVNVEGWSDDPRFGTAVDLHAQYSRHLNGCSTPGFRHSFFLAALDAWRLVNLGLLTLDQMRDDLTAVTQRVWNAGPDAADKQIVNVEAHAKAEASPWQLVGMGEGGIKLGTGELVAPREPLPGEAVPASAEQQAGNLAAAYELKVREEVERQDIREEATRRRRLRERQGRPSIADGLLDVTELANIGAPRMLLDSLIPANSIGFLNGRTGTYKSFLAVSWACSLATGRPWQGRDEFAVSEPVKVLYVAAEGAAGIAQRVISWQAVNGPIASGMLAVYPKPIRLADEFEVAELAELVAEREFEFLVVDTLHRSSPGLEENSATDFSLVFEAVANLRDEHGLTTLFVDHTGHRGGVIGRGTTAKVDDPDFVLGVEREGEIPTPDVQRTLKVVKLKDAPVHGEWSIRLAAVDGAPAAVLELGTVASEDGDPFGMRDAEWWQHEAAEALPDAVSRLHGPGADAAREVFRVLRFIADEQGSTIPELIRAVNLRPSGKRYSEATVRRGVRLLDTAGVLVATGSRWALDASVTGPVTD